MTIDDTIADVRRLDAEATDWANRTRRDEYYRTAAPALCDEIERLRAALDAETERREVVERLVELYWNECFDDDRNQGPYFCICQKCLSVKQYRARYGGSQ